MEPIKITTTEPSVELTNLKKIISENQTQDWKIELMTKDDFEQKEDGFSVLESIRCYTCDYQILGEIRNDLKDKFDGITLINVETVHTPNLYSLTIMCVYY